MEEIKEKAIELLSDIISKEDFEMMLYEKVETEDLLKNRLLFDLVNINYKLDFYKEKILKTYNNEIDRQTYLIYNLNFYCKKIIKSEFNFDKVKWFEKAFNLFSYVKIIT